MRLTRKGTRASTTALLTGTCAVCVCVHIRERVGDFVQKGCHTYVYMYIVCVYVYGDIWNG